MRGSASLYVEIPASELLKEPSYKEQMQLGDDIRDALDNELQIYTPNLDANMTSMISGRYQRVFNVDMDFAGDTTVDGYEDLLDTYCMQTSNIQLLIKKILKDGGFMTDQEQTQQDKEAAEKLQKIDDADGMELVDVNEDVNFLKTCYLTRVEKMYQRVVGPRMSCKIWMD